MEGQAPNLEQLLSNTIEPMRSAHAELLGHEQRLAEELGDVRENLKRITRLLRVLDPDFNSDQAKREVRKRAPGKALRKRDESGRERPTPYALDKIVKAAVRLEERGREVTNANLAEEAKLPLAVIKLATPSLHKEYEVFRLVGAGTHGAHIFKVVPGAQLPFTQEELDKSHDDTTATSATEMAWYEREHVVNFEKRALRVYEFMSDVGGVLISEVAKALDETEGRVGDSIRALRDRGIVKASGVRRRPPWAEEGRYSDEWIAVEGSEFIDRMGNTIDHSPISEQLSAVLEDMGAPTGETNDEPQPVQAA
jgi:DNA-binding transcriptional ArsR family regulator